jgi:hypothetical protein
VTEREAVGTLAEEAAKLLAAVQGWVGESAGRFDEPADDSEAGPSDAHSQHSGQPGLSGECRWCPICQLVRAARATSPEVREHLSQAAVSLALAVRGLLEEPSQAARRTGPLEKIDLTEEAE